MLHNTLSLGIGLGLGLAIGVALNTLPLAQAGDLTPRAVKKLDRYAAKARKTADKKGIVAGGVATALVTDNVDPDELGRVKVRFPWDAAEESASEWARVVTIIDADGFYMLPEVGDEVLVSFVHGDIRRPIVIGALWNAEDGPPARPPQRSR